MAKSASIERIADQRRRRNSDLFPISISLTDIPIAIEYDNSDTLSEKKLAELIGEKIAIRNIDVVHPIYRAI